MRSRRCSTTATRSSSTPLANLQRFASACGARCAVCGFNPQPVGRVGNPLRSSSHRADQRLYVPQQCENANFGAVRADAWAPSRSASATCCIRRVGSASAAVSTSPARVIRWTPFERRLKAFAQRYGVQVSGARRAAITQSAYAGSHGARTPSTTASIWPWSTVPSRRTAGSVDLIASTPKLAANSGEHRYMICGKFLSGPETCLRRVRVERPWAIGDRLSFSTRGFDTYGQEKWFNGLEKCRPSVVKQLDAFPELAKRGEAEKLKEERSYHCRAGGCCHSGGSQCAQHNDELVGHHRRRLRPRAVANPAELRALPWTHWISGTKGLIRETESRIVHQRPVPPSLNMSVLRAASISCVAYLERDPRKKPGQASARRRPVVMATIEEKHLEECRQKNITPFSAWLRSGRGQWPICGTGAPALFRSASIRSISRRLNAGAHGKYFAHQFRTGNPISAEVHRTALWSWQNNQWTRNACSKSSRTDLTLPVKWARSHLYLTGMRKCTPCPQIWTCQRAFLDELRRHTFQTCQRAQEPWPCLANTPVKTAEGLEVVRSKWSRPAPRSSLAGAGVHRQNLYRGDLIKGYKDGQQRETVHLTTCPTMRKPFAETDSQGISYTAGVPAGGPRPC
ncbi:hypothetical protein FQR65_LT20304 [Abscondita terminalis]|nr:hypothetical protein FQR65_LT20304 [Abscondita terminalis]